MPDQTPAVAPNTPPAAIPVEQPIDPMEATIRATLAEIPPDEPDAPDAEGRKRDPQTGQFLPTEVAKPGEEITSLPDDDPSQDVVDEVIVPEGYVVAPVLAEDKAKAFKVYDAEGEIAPPDLTFEFMANGKPTKISTDKLISYAQMGRYNHEREQAAQQIQTENFQMKQTQESLQQELETRDRQMEMLLSDPDYLQRAQEAFAQQNTPEARNERLERQLQEERNRSAIREIQTQGQTFIETELLPGLQMMTEALPNVLPEELAAKATLFVEQQKGRSGLIEPSRYSAVRAFVTNELLPWAQQLNEHRSLEREAPKKAVETVTQDAQKKVDQLRAKNQKLRRVSTVALKPTGSVTSTSQPQKAVRTNKDAESAVIGNTMDAMRQAG